MTSIIKLPNNISNDDIIEIKYRIEIGVKYSILKKKYNISYYDIKRLCRLFADCDTSDSVQMTKDRFAIENAEKRNVDHKINYQKYKKYYTKYNRERQQKLYRKRDEEKIDIVNNIEENKTTDN